MAFLLLFVHQACRKKSDNPPKTEPSKEQLGDDLLKALSDMRLGLEIYFDVTGVIGREIYVFSPIEQRYTIDLLGGGNATLSNNQFYITDPCTAQYKVIKNVMQVIKGAHQSTKLTDADRRGLTGVAKTIIAHELLMNLNLTHTNGIYINLASNNPASGPKN